MAVLLMKFTAALFQRIRSKAIYLANKIAQYSAQVINSFPSSSIQVEHLLLHMYSELFIHAIVGYMVHKFFR